MLPAFISQRGCHTCTWIGMMMVFFSALTGFSPGSQVVFSLQTPTFLNCSSIHNVADELPLHERNPNIIIIIISSVVLDLRSHKQQQGSKVGNLQQFSQSTHASSAIMNRVE